MSSAHATTTCAGVARCTARPTGSAAAAFKAATCAPRQLPAAAAGAVHRRRRRHSSAAVTAAASSSSTTAAAAASTQQASTNQLPRTPAAMVDQAAAAVQAALDGGKMRQQLTFLLPINEKEADFNATEPIDYPCSLQKEFDTACALTKSLMQRLLGAATPINAKRIDDGGVEGEPCGVLFPEDCSFLAVVFPTADRLKQLQAFAKEAGRPLLIVNAQWRNEGQVISDFGWGPLRKAADDFLATFEPSYVLRERRIGSPGTVNAATGTRFTTGGVVRVLRQYPQAKYECYATSPDGASQLMEAPDKEPSYQDLDAMIKRGRAAKLEIFTLAQRATAIPSMTPASAAAAAAEADALAAAAAAAAAGSSSSSSSSGEDGSEDVGGMSDADIEAMDAATLRRLLLARGLPGSGKISKLRERLREARDAA